MTQHPCRGPGWVRTCQTYVVGYRDPRTRAERRRFKSSVPVHARRAVYLAPDGTAYPAAKVDRAVAAMPRGRGAVVVAAETGDGFGRRLSFRWAAPMRNGALHIAPVLP